MTEFAIAASWWGNVSFLFSVSLFFHLTNGLTVKIQAPTKNGTFDIGIIITPGASIKGEAYAKLGSKLQETFPGRMWIALLCDFVFDTPNPVQLGSGVDDAITKFKAAGFQGNYIFLAGHSLGGLFVGEYGLKYASKLSGVLLFAAYLTRSHRLRDYPIPVLTVSGDLDGLTRMTRIVDTFEELKNETIHNPSPMSFMYLRPVIVLRGINHGHFASGEMPQNVVKHDLPADSDISFDTAHENIAWSVTCFINVITRLPLEDFLPAVACMKAHYYQTMDFMEPLSRMKALDINSNTSSGSTEMAQRYILGEKLAQHVTVNDTEVSSAVIGFYEPDVQVNVTNAHVQTFSSVVLPFDPEDVSMYPQTPTEIQSVMKSQEGIRKLLPDIPYDSRNVTCRDINQLLFNLAYNASSEIARNRYMDRKCPSIVFNDDVIFGSMMQWAISSLNLQYGSNGELSVTSPSFTTAADDSTGKTSGTIHCKLFSPYRALEWLYIDSLKRSN